MRILAVDDDPIILDLLETSLGQAGYTDLVTARSAEHALSVLETVEQPFDCLLFDIVMPGMDGVALCETVRRMPTYATTPILMISRLDEKKHFDRAFAAGANDYVTKPLDATELGVRLRLADQISSQQRQIAAQTGTTTARKVLVSEAFMLDDVPGAIDNMALDAYLERIPNGFAGMQFFAVKIANIVDLHRKATPDEFRLIVNSVADAVTDVLAGSSFFITHSGNGILSFVVHGHTDMTVDEVARMVLTEAGGLDFVLASGNTVIPEIIIGTGTTRTLTRAGRIQALREAVMDAEEVAATITRLGVQSMAHSAPRSGFLDRLMAGI
ncbi:Response regulator receiver domain-containing protein [Roseivivax lentus]|uniref:Response regulator receiver domain-containing protein n=1 Tax=Roseivivax lentus TaxID=633194 RepID=A0A1N7P6G8_9RHOB|nr:response regulator [Roseivivax lentus]SIT06184.1 Response regulator receiver domain-containing protein [Roseivivax lentus]